MDKGVLLGKMLLFATKAHANQFDKGGNPYILHPLKVMHYCKTDDEELMAIALGHDIVEDCKVTYEELRNEGFTERVIEGIKSLTKVPGESHKDYLDKVMKNSDAVLVKLADLRHNSDIRRLKGLTQKDFDRMKRYAEDYKILNDWRKNHG